MTVKDTCNEKEILMENMINIEEMIPWSMQIAIAMILILQGLTTICCSCYILAVTTKSKKMTEKILMMDIDGRSKGCQSPCTYERKAMNPRFKVLPLEVQG